MRRVGKNSRDVDQTYGKLSGGPEQKLAGLLGVIGAPGSDIPLRASALGAYSSPSSSPLSSSSPSLPLQLDADFFWLADTGATSHMTPHRHWFKSYSPNCIPIRLADNSTIYSAGVGSVVFQPHQENENPTFVQLK
ncbi:hypothetical protein Agabi119p4_10568 [Agaricus bisporus var. burnettii]|uniref:Retrovirus-related Pol polyprotein from transposon TNT 1-94-like beta-barrel domain-containing protein n=1 Tax=Agaricus bisporus var. burnettii TaxID=192524 RepID=A0A8H7C1T0_AGABI|nr:hypothetical protein Agabi119p4_10568 [Agaricus bisporus var. burnettii]